MTRFLIILTAAVMLFIPRASAQTVIGDLNNFDTLNDTGQICYGFEIEIDGARSTDITYTFDWNHYGAPKIAEDTTDPANPKVFVRYESTKDASGQWGANSSFTNLAAPTMTPPQGHTCTDTTVNEGCEHFGVGYYNVPTAVRYHWLVDNGAGGLGYIGSVAIGTPKWTYVPPAAGAPAQAVAVIPAPVVPNAVVEGREFGEPSWVKVIKTTTHNANPVALLDLVSRDADGDGKADWQNNEPDEVESEWRLLQANSGVNPALAEVAGSPDEMGDGSETVTRRYEFYRYGATVDTLDGETGEAMCSDVNPTTDPTDPNYLHGLGNNVAVTDANGDTYYVDCTAQVVVGNYIGAQMAGFAAAAPLGLIDHVQEGQANSSYPPRTVVVGGLPPYTISLVSGSLPPGLTLENYFDPISGETRPGVLSGTPTAGGDFPFSVGVFDSNGSYVSQAYSLHIIGAPVQQIDLVVQKGGTGTGTVSGNGIDCGPACSAHLDAGTSVALRATADPDSVFVGWSGACTGTGTCIFTLEAASTVVATFNTKQWTLTATKGGTGTGTVSGNGIDCGGTCSATLDQGTAVSLTATPALGSVFTGWSGDCSGTSTCSPTIDADRTVTATFVPTTQQYLLTVGVTGSGSVTSSPKGISCGKQCSKLFTVDSSVTLTAKPAKKHQFLGWTGACLAYGTSLTCTVPVLKAEFVGANFN